MTAVVLGFPVALILAWAFELTPEGVKRTEEASPGKPIRDKRRGKWTAIIFLRLPSRSIMRMKASLSPTWAALGVGSITE